jgi:hypothetical protein
MKSIEITFKTDGTSEIKAPGFKGSACQAATADFEKALGTVVTDTKLPEFYQTQTAQLKQTV